jgi:hypothetical protein
MQEAVVRMKAWWPPYKAQFGNFNSVNGHSSSDGDSAASAVGSSSTI